MRFLKVQKFLCCISLETGGLAVAWINIMVSTIALFGIMSALILITAYNYGDIWSNPDIIGGYVGESHDVC